MPPRKKVARKEKPAAELWTVIDQEGRLKYQSALGAQAVGFDKNLALDIAQPAHGSHAYRAVPVSEVHDAHQATTT